MSNQPPYNQPPYPPQEPSGGYPPQQPGGYYPPAGAPQQYGYGAVPVAQPEKGGGLAIAGLILGIISIPIAFFPICGVITGIVGFVLSILGRRAPSKRTMATIGMILSIIGFLLAIGLWVVGTALILSNQH